MAVNVLVCVLVHPSVATAPSLDVTVGVLQPSVAVALPRADSIAAAVGLQSRSIASKLLVNSGAVTSTIQLTVLDEVAVLPQ